MKRILIASSLLVALVIPINTPATAGDGVLWIAPDNTSSYERSMFKLWVDADGNGCDTRAEVLIKEAVVKPKIGANCKLTGGTWVSSYDGVTYKDASKLDIDHLVPLAEAWRSGAWEWDEQQRQDFANDLEQEWALNAVTASVNRSKGDKDISSWLPKKNLCAYLIGWASVKSRYQLSVDKAEALVINKYYKSCGLGHQTKERVDRNPVPTVTSEVSPTSAISQSPSTSSTSAQSAEPTGAPTISAETPSATKVPAVKYSNCTAAKAAKVIPIKRATNPDLYAMNSGLDRDKDGVACE